MIGTNNPHPLDPKLFDISNENAAEWRIRLKMELLKERDWRSDVSGLVIPNINAAHMHEGILTRADVPKSLWWQWMIFHPYNCFLLLPNEHIPLPPTRGTCAKLAFDRYGKDNVSYWYENLPWKNGIPRII